MMQTLSGRIGLAALAVWASGCGQSRVLPATGLELIVATDGLSAPTDFDDIRIEVSQLVDGNANVLWNRDYVVPSLEATLPATFAVNSGRTPDEEVLVAVTAFHGGPGGTPVVQRVAQVQSPSDRVAALWMVLARVCEGQVTTTGAEGEVMSTCPPGQSCQPGNGQCGSNVINASTLPTYQPGQSIDGGVEAGLALGDAGMGDVGSIDATTDGAAVLQGASEDGSVSDADAAPALVTIIYVSALGNDGWDGVTPATPVQTIRKGIAQASMCSPQCEVHVAGGLYNETDTITIADGVSVLGGYSPSDFTRGTTQTDVGVPGNNTVMRIDSIQHKTVIDGLVLTGSDIATSGGATYVVRISNSNGTDGSGNALLSLTNSSITAGHGGQGANGANGGSVSCSEAGGTGGGPYTCGAACDCGCGPFSGSRGQDGQSGAPGAVPSQNVDNIGSFTNDLWQPASPINGDNGTSGAPGLGGGGGGTVPQCGETPGNDLIGGGGGTGGNGGCGGAGGGGGTEGGGSFGVVVDGSTVDFSGSSVAAGAGGNGGNGGDGGDGLQGAGGQSGGSGACGAALACSGGAVCSGSGGSGGNGGSGGGGSGGDPGNGGPSVAVAKLGVVKVMGTGYTFTAGSGGSPGTPGTGGINQYDGSQAPNGITGISGASSEQFEYGAADQ
jgi:hypothetical protein